MSEPELVECRVSGIVPADYPDEVASDWPDLLEIIERRVLPDRRKQTRPALKNRWWQYAEKRPGLYRSIHGMDSVFVNSSKATPQYSIAMLDNGLIYSQNLNVFALQGMAAFCVLQSSAHELWARFFGTTFEDRLTYAKEECFETFPFPTNYDQSDRLCEAGRA